VISKEKSRKYALKTGLFLILAVHAFNAVYFSILSFFVYRALSTNPHQEFFFHVAREAMEKHCFVFAFFSIANVFAVFFIIFFIRSFFYQLWKIRLLFSVELFLAVASSIFLSNALMYAAWGVVYLCGFLWWGLKRNIPAPK
jgi:hypothetical protein